MVSCLSVETEHFPASFLQRKWVSSNTSNTRMVKGPDRLQSYAFLHLTEIGIATAHQHPTLHGHRIRHCSKEIKNHFREGNEVLQAKRSQKLQSNFCLFYHELTGICISHCLERFPGPVPGFLLKFLKLPMFIQQNTRFSHAWNHKNGPFWLSKSLAVKRKGTARHTEKISLSIEKTLFLTIVNLFLQDTNQVHIAIERQPLTPCITAM